MGGSCRHRADPRPPIRSRRGAADRGRAAHDEGPETAEVTTVIDAFDKDDPFDLNISIGFSQMWKNANIRRETNLFQPGLSTGGFVPATENVAHYTQSVSTLNMGLDIGIFRDLALALRLPLILADSRALSPLDGSDKNPQRLQDANGQQLFSVPFKSPTRSGVDWFSAGLDYAIMNQQRDWTKPTWIVGVEGRFGVGARLHACNDQAAIKCPDPNNPGQDRSDPGISRGMYGVGVHTLSFAAFRLRRAVHGLQHPRRVRAIEQRFWGHQRSARVAREPPAADRARSRWGSRSFRTSTASSSSASSVDFRVNGSYISPGPRILSELFDALGTSASSLL